jgi:asparagine synthase (glutamine-hydrolysing)
VTGFAVVVRSPSVAATPDDLRALLPALRRRGPHGESIVTDGPFGAATTRLDLGDPRLAVATAEAGRFAVAGQVRVDARDALVDALRRAGARATVDDADVQLFAFAWSIWGDDAPGRILGDFSAVVHHRDSHVTTLVRDPFGVRMLFHHAGAERLVASNTLAAVLDAGVSRELNEDAIADFVAEGFNEDPATTTFRAVRRVPPAHLLRIHPDGRQELRRYWELPSPEIDRSRDAAAIVAEFRRLLEASVHDRIRSPALTVFMSGGLDSTTLAAIAARHVDDPTRVVARTAHLPTLAPSDETERARLAAAWIGIPRVLTDVDQYGYREGTSHPLPSTPEPTGDPDLLALQDELRRASAHAPVAFWGEDPDAYLAPPHLGDLLRGSAAPRLALDVLGYVWREGTRPHLGVRGLLRGRRQPTGAQSEASGEPAYLRADLRRRRAERLRERTEPGHPTRSEAARRLDQFHWQPFLESLDAGFHGIPIEVRLPYLDLRLIAFALAVPPIPWLQRKRLLRDAAQGLVPDVVRLAPKQGLVGLYEARLAQWWSRAPAPFVPSDTLARFVDVRALPVIDRASSVNDALVHLRLRLLDRWLRAHEEAPARASGQ